MRLRAHLWTHEEAPLEYIRLKLCRDVYHCTPSQLEAVPWRIIAEDLAMLRIEAEIRERQWPKKPS